MSRAQTILLHPYRGMTPTVENVVREILAELATPQIDSSLTGTLSSTAHARFTCTATLSLTGLAPPSSRISGTVP